jgi:hypothetical protein
MPILEIGCQYSSFLGIRVFCYISNAALHPRGFLHWLKASGYMADGHR